MEKFVINKTTQSFSEIKPRSYFPTISKSKPSKIRGPLFQSRLNQRNSLQINKSTQQLNQSKHIMSFHVNSTNFKKLQSHKRMASQNMKLREIESFQKHRKRNYNIQYSTSKCQQPDKQNRVSLTKINTYVDGFNSGTSNSIENQNMGQFSFEQSLNEVDISPLQNVCYDSQFPYKRTGDIMKIFEGRKYLMGGVIRRKMFFPSPDSLNKQILLHYYKDQWHQEQIQNDKLPRFSNLIGHTLQIINKNLVLTFGMSGDSVKTLKQFNPSLILYNLEKKQFSEIQYDVKIRSHASTSYENYLFVHGGINHQVNVVKQMYVFYFSEGDHPKIITIPSGEALANHKMVTTLGMDVSTRINLKQNDGIFIFGGSNSQGKLNNDLKILRVNPNNFQHERKINKKFEKVKSKGEKPSPRMNHSMNLLANKGKIVIVGGNDNLNHLYSDIWVFDLIFSQWSEYKSNPDLKLVYGGISKHCTCIDGMQLFIFGGQTEYNIGNNNFWCIELDNTKKLREQIRKKKQRENTSKLSSFWSISTSKNIDLTQLQGDDYIL